MEQVSFQSVFSEDLPIFDILLYKQNNFFAVHISLVYNIYENKYVAIDIILQSQVTFVCFEKQFIQNITVFLRNDLKEFLSTKYWNFNKGMKNSYILQSGLFILLLKFRIVSLKFLYHKSQTKINNVERGLLLSYLKLKNVKLIPHNRVFC